MVSQYGSVQAGDVAGRTGARDRAADRPEHPAAAGGRNVDVVGSTFPKPDPSVVEAVRALERQLRETHRALDAFVDRLDPPTA